VPSEGDLTYSSDSVEHGNSFSLTAPDGNKYRLFLLPELDTGQHVVVLDLVLRRDSDRSENSNLLAPTENWHGYQPFCFAASDFARGAEASSFGSVRTIDVPKIGMQLRIKAAVVDVEPNSKESSTGLTFRFGNIALQIAYKRLKAS
jgi:hypothetical protein